MKTILTTLFVLVASILLAQPSLSFQRCYGGTNDENAVKMFDCHGNGFVVFGTTTSYNGDVTGNHGGMDIWVFRNDSTGAIVWQKCLGGTANEDLDNVFATNDGGYVVMGTTYSNNGDVSGNAGGKDIWTFKIDSLGNLLWQNSIGGSLDEADNNSNLSYFFHYQANTQELIVDFDSYSNDGDLTAALGDLDIWKATIDSLGNVIVENPLSSPSADDLFTVFGLNYTPVYDVANLLYVGTDGYTFSGNSSFMGGFTTDGGYIVAWEDLTEGVVGCVKYANTGIVQGDYSASIAGQCNTNMTSGIAGPTANGFIVSYETEFFGCFGPPPSQDTYKYIYNNAGNLLASCGTSFETNGGGFSSWGDCNITYPPYYPPSDTALEGGLIRFQSGITAEKNSFSHTLEWTKTLGGTGYEAYADDIQRPDTAYWILGTTNSTNGDVSGNHSNNGSNDIWLTALSPAKNTASGYVWEDANSSGAIDAGDLPVSNLLLQAATSSSTAYAVSQANGKYDLNIAIGNYVVSAPNLPLYHVLQPATDMVSFSNNNGNIDSLNSFLMLTTPNIQDLRINLTALSAPHTGMARAYDLSYKNVGTQNSAATIRYIFDGNEGFFSALPAPDTLTATYASWNVSTLLPSQSGSISLITGISPAASGAMITAIAMIYPFANEQYLADNTEILQEIATTLFVGAPFDPNDKLVSPAGNPNLNNFLSHEKYLTYTIRFQNTGTAPAINVVLKDTLSHLLDITTLEILSASHDFVARIPEIGKLTITYPNIMLPDSGANYLGSQGFIKFRIKPKSPVGYCQAIGNSASIYFDYNAPVKTNETSTFFLPEASTITTTLTDTICVYQSYDLTCSTPILNFENTWGSNGGSLSSATGNQVTLFANSLNYHQVTLTQSISAIPGCEVSAAPINFWANPVPNAYFNPHNITLCEGNSLTLLAANNAANMICHYVWSFNGNMVGTDTNTYQIPQISLSQQGNYNLSVTNQYGCNRTGQSVITVKPSPTVSINAISATEVCPGDTVTLMAMPSAGTTLYWQKNGGSIAGGTNGTLKPTITGAYRAVANINYNGFNCKDTSNVIGVTIKPLPIVSVSNVGPLTFCDGSSVILNASAIAGYNYVWKESGVPIAGATASSYQTGQAGIYTVTVTDSNTCLKTSSAKTVAVNPKPVVTAFAGNTSLCQGDTVLLTASATAGVTFQWQKNNSNVAGGTNDSLSVILSGNYRVLVVNGSNCKDTSALIAVTVHALPTATLTNVGAFTFCDGNSVTFNANAVAGYNYVWKESGVPIAGATTNSYQTGLAGVYAVTVTDSNTCVKTSLPKIVVVNPKPTINVTSTGSIALGNALLIANATPNATFQWQKNNSNIANGTHDSLYVTVMGNYRVIAKTSANCRDTSGVNQITEQGNNPLMISIYPNPAQEEVFVSWESADNSAAKVSLTDIAGKQVFAQNIVQKPKTEVIIPVSDLAEGVYLLRIEANEGVYTEKVVVRR